MFGSPRKRQSIQGAQEWSGSAYDAVCAFMRGNVRQRAAAKRVIASLTTYMKHTAIVAPAAPAGMQRPQVLWRGVSRMRPPQAGETVSSNGGCFTAFSYIRRVAAGFGGEGYGEEVQGYMYRLQVDRIARGTPWVWFTERLRPGLPPRWKEVVGAQYEREGEILLPPGYFKVLSVQRPPGKIPVVDVAFVPRPDYMRRGAVPRFNAQGRVVTTTVGGHHLVTDSPAAAANVKLRRNRIALVAAAKASRAAAARGRPVLRRSMQIQRQNRPFAITRKDARRG